MVPTKQYSIRLKVQHQKNGNTLNKYKKLPGYSVAREFLDLRYSKFYLIEINKLSKTELSVLNKIIDHYKKSSHHNSIK